MLKVLPFALVTSLMFAHAPDSVGQSEHQQNNTWSPQLILGTCEDNISLLSQAHQAAGSDGTIIAIARSGDRERRRELNHRRLHNIRVYLTEFGWHRAPETVITAEGTRVNGYGRVELYVRGILFTILGVERNRDLLAGSCEPDEIRPVKAERNLYPFLDRKPPRKSKQTKKTG